MNKLSNRYQEDGFTFAEILITIAIMAVILPALLKVFSDTSRNMALADNRATALFLLKSEMSKIEMQGFPEVGQQNDVIGNSIYEWQSVVSDIESDEIEGIRRVELTISWEHLGKIQSMSMFTYIADKERQQQGR